MSYECATEWNPSYYRCIDPIENFKIKVVLKPVKSLYIPLPQFNVDDSDEAISSTENDGKQEVEEYTFRWQERVLNKSEIKKCKDSAFKSKLSEKYQKHLSNLSNTLNTSSKLFSYVDVDDYLSNTHDLTNFTSNTSITQSSTIDFSNNFANVSKTKIINYYPLKKKLQKSNKFIQKMFIMIDLGSNSSSKQEEEMYKILCMLTYNESNNMLEIIPEFSISEMNPYVIGEGIQDNRNSFYYWLFHASNDISNICLKKEVEIMAKVFYHQEEMKKLLVGTEFFVGEVNQLFITIFGEIVSAQDFEYDYLYIKYFLKLPSEWGSCEPKNLCGVTQTSKRNSLGITYFSYLFELNFSVSLQLFEDYELSSPEIIFEVLSVDNYNRYRNEGYSFISMPHSPGMYSYNLKCWRAVDKDFTSQLRRFFIGGGPELHDVTYVGLSNTHKTELISRFGFETTSSGYITVKLNILHQSECYKKKEATQSVIYKGIGYKPNTTALLSNINEVLEAFRKARARMLEAKKELEPQLSNLCLNT